MAGLQLTSQRFVPAPAGTKLARTSNRAALPFDAEINFYRQRNLIPASKWPDILRCAHTRAFTVAEAMKDAMLVDARSAIDEAIANGMTIADFRKSVDAIFSHYGWDYQGTRGWRSRALYNANLRAAFAAGRRRQMTGGQS